MSLNIKLSESWYSLRVVQSLSCLVPEYSHAPKKKSQHPFSLLPQPLTASLLPTSTELHEALTILMRWLKLTFEMLSKCFIRMGTKYVGIGTKEDQGSVRPFPLELWLAPPRTQQETDVACYEKRSGQPFSYYLFSSFSLSIVSIREVTIKHSHCKGLEPK